MGFFQQIGVGLVSGGETLHLSVLGRVVDGRTTIDIVIAELAAHYDVLYLDVIAIATRTTAGDDAVGVELVDHLLGTKGRIDLADAAFAHQHIAVGEELLQLLQLLIHSYDNTYFHVFFNCFGCKVTKFIVILQPK